MPTDDPQETRSAAAVTVAIFLSKLVGLLRQRISAHFFGTSAVADAIAAAFRVGNLAQNLLGEGTLSASFIPIYAKLRAEGRHKEAATFAQAALGMLAAVVILISAVGIALAPWLSLLVAAGFDEAKRALTTRLVRIVFPMTGLLVLCAWALGVLNAHRRFFLPYVAPVVWSALQIAAMIIGGSWLLQSGEVLARSLAFGALAGAFIEMLLLLNQARKCLGTLRPLWEPANPWLREAAKRLPNVILGRGVIQISGLLDTLLVSFAGDGANATFVYAQTLYLLPMSLLGTGEAAVSLPAMASDTAVVDEAEQHRRMRQRLGRTLTRILVLAVPAMVVLGLFGEELITVLFRTGRFDAQSTRRVASAVQMYSIALLANASVRMFATTFFALGNTRLPARYALLRVIVSGVLALVLLGPLGVEGVVLAAVIAGWAEAITLGWALRKHLGGLGLDALPNGRIFLLLLITAGTPGLLQQGLPRGFSDTWFGAFTVLATCGVAFAVAAAQLRLFDLRTFLRRR